jgi:hypothetical protein
MSSTLEFGKKILIKRMVASLEKEGYKVEFAPDYEGFIIADRRDDPNIFLLATGTIEQLRNEHAGNPTAFLDAVLRHVKHNISIGAISVPPPSGPQPEGAVQHYVPAGPPPLRVVPGEEAGEDGVPTGEFQQVPRQEGAQDLAEEVEGDDVEEISNILEDEDLKNQ